MAPPTVLGMGHRQLGTKTASSLSREHSNKIFLCHTETRSACITKTLIKWWKQSNYSLKHVITNNLFARNVIIFRLMKSRFALNINT